MIKIAEGIFNESGEINVSPGSNTGRSKFSPVKATEVYTKLKNNSWLKLDGKYYVDLGDNGLFLYRDYTSTPPSSDIELLPTTEPNSNLGKFRLQEILSDHSESVKEDLISSVNNIDYEIFRSLEVPESNHPVPSREKSYIGGYYNKNTYREAKIYDGSDEYFRTKQYFNLLPSPDIYTNRIDLNKILDYIKIPDTSFKFNISFEYTIGDNVRRKIVTRDTLFWYDSAGELNKKSYKEEFNSEVVVFLDPSRNTLECCPLKSNIKECIFSSCIVEYGKEQQ